MKVFLDKDERMSYEVNTDGWGVEFSVDKRKADRWLKVLEKYYKIQDEIEKVYREKLVIMQRGG